MRPVARQGLLGLLSLVAFASVPLLAGLNPSTPCAGVVVEDPAAFLPALAAPPRLAGEATLIVSWRVPLDGSAKADVAQQVADLGGLPWLDAHFRTPPPLAASGSSLESELDELSLLAQRAPATTRFVISWEALGSGAGEARLAEYAYLLKRAAATLEGATGHVQAVTAPLEGGSAALGRLLDAGITSYVEAISIRATPAPELARSLATLRAVDLGKPVVLVGGTVGDDAGAALVEAARATASGAALVLLAFPDPTSDRLRPFKILATELAGDFGIGPPVRTGPESEAWAFVRASDLEQRVIVRSGQEARKTALAFSDRALGHPIAVDPVTGESHTVPGGRSTATGFELVLSNPKSLTILRLDRSSTGPLADVSAQAIVASDRPMPVEEILRRLQAFEDAQARRLASYRAVYTEHQRYRFDADVSTSEITMTGSYFFRRGEPVDWAWESFYVDGVRWRGTKAPVLQLVQPQRAASLPLEIDLTPAYRYALRGTEEVDGRQTWVVDFEPADPAKAAGLYRGTVWIDRELYARVKSSTVQLGLVGAVISNAETTHFLPVDGEGKRAAWRRESFVLPLRTSGQRLERVVGNTIQVERETTLDALLINSSDFDECRDGAYRSEATMVRETPQGLRPLVKRVDGTTREIDPKPRRDVLYLVGGVLYDRSLDDPFPLVGLSYYTDDLLKTGAQAQFFASPLIGGTIAAPSLLGTRWNGGVDIGGILIFADETPYRDGKESKPETVRHGATSVHLFAAHPLGDFGEIKLGYGLGLDRFARADDSAGDFVLPQSTWVHSGALELSYRREGWGFVASGNYNHRSTWSSWGLPESGEYEPRQQDYLHYRAAIGKTWWGARHSKLGVGAEWMGGQDLDRFSKYGFGPLADVRVAGYPFGLITASQAFGAHVNGAATLGDVVQLQLCGDAVWATDRASGLHRELLAGIGVAGTLVGPWETIITFDLGVPVAGPGRGVTATVFILRKLF